MSGKQQALIDLVMQHVSLTPELMEELKMDLIIYGFCAVHINDDGTGRRVSPTDVEKGTT